MTDTNATPVLRLFVSSPGDVQRERERVDLVVERLNAEFAGRVKLQSVRWETSYYSSHDTFQNQIPEAAECDVVVAIFRARLGTQLPESFPHMPDGEPYPSGTAYEVLTAIEASRKNKGTPDIYVFREPRPPSITLDDAGRADIEAQWIRLKQFFERWFRNRSGEFLAAFQEFGTTDEFAAKVEDCLRQWLARRGFASTGPVWDRIRFGSPFPGLAAFDESRKTIFFGRSAVIQQAIQRLRETGDSADKVRAPFLLIIGASGSGKSSLLSAGLLPKLVEPGAVPPIDLWRVARLTPGPDPFASLAESLFDEKALGTELRAGAFRTKEILARQLQSEPDLALAPLRDALTAAAEARRLSAGFSEPRPARLALAIDQAERLFVETEPQVAQRFAALLAALTQHRLAYVIMVLRSDAYSLLQTVQPLVALREAGASLDVLPPNDAELEEMATRPVAACDPPLAFERKDGRSLAERLIADAKGGDTLPLLQMTLARLAAAEAARGDGVLRFADYNGLAEAVTQTANEALGGLNAEAQHELPALVTGLVRDVGADPMTGAPVPVIAALERGAFEAGNPARKALIDAFVAKRLLTTEGDAASQRVRPVHESLLRIWPQAVSIVAEAGNLIRVRHALGPIAREWRLAPEAEKARHLDISPALLSGAQRLVERFGADVPQDMRAFVAASSALAESRAAQEREAQERRLRDAQALAKANRRTAQISGAGLVAALALAALAVWQWRAADAAKLDAQRQSDRAAHVLALATDTANSLIVDLAQKLRNTTGLPISLVKDILDRARGLQDQLLGAGELTFDLRKSQALALIETGRTWLTLGDTKSAMADTTQARALFEDLAKTNPIISIQSDRALAIDQIGDILRLQGDLPSALKLHQESRVIREALIAANPDNIELQRDLSITITEIAKVQQSQGDLKGAVQTYRDGLDVAKKVLASDPSNPTYRRDLSVGYADLGLGLANSGDLAGALAAYREDLKISEDLAASDPTNAVYQRDISTTELDLGDALRAQGDLKGSLDSYGRARAIRKTLADADAGDAQAQRDLANADNEEGAAMRALGDTDGSLKVYDEALKIAQALVARDPSNELWQRDLSVSDEVLGAVMRDRGDYAAALKYYNDGQAIALALSAKDPSNADMRRDVAVGESDIATVLQAEGDYAGALRHEQEDKRITAEIAARDPSNMLLQSDLRNCDTALGDIETKLGDRAAALAIYQEAKSLALAISQSDPANAAARRALAIADNNIGDTVDDPVQKFAAYKEAQAILAALADADVGNLDRQDDLAASYDKIGDTLQAKGDLAGALAQYSQEFAIRQKALAVDPASAPRSATLAACSIRIAAADLAKGETAGARASYSQARDLLQGLVDRNAADANANRLLSIAWEGLGDIANSANDLKAARNAFQAALDLALAAQKTNPTLKQPREDVAIVETKLAAAMQGLGDAAAAAPLLADAVALRRGLAAEAPKDLPAQRAYAFAIDRVGDAARTAGDYDAARAAYTEELGIFAALNAPDAETRRDLAIVRNRLGAVLKAKGDLAGAASAHREALALTRALAAEDPANALYRADIAFTDEALADVLQAQGDAKSALEAYGEAEAARAPRAGETLKPTDARALEILRNKIGFLLIAQGDVAGAREKFAAALEGAKAVLASAPDNGLFRFDVGYSQQNLADALARLNDAVGAEAAYRDAFATLSALQQSDPDPQRWKPALWGAAQKLAGFLNGAGRPDEALPYARQAHAIVTELVAAQPANATYQNALKQSVTQIGFIANAQLIADQPAKALAALEDATPMTADLNWLDLIRGEALMLLGRDEEARPLFLKHRGEPSFGGKTYEVLLIESFKRMRDKGVSDPLMDEIEKALGEKS